MKTFLKTLLLFILLVSCTNETTEINQNPTNAIEGSWSLVSVSGGFAPTINLDPSWITYHFGQNLTVINNNPSMTAQATGLETGSYAYSFIQDPLYDGLPNYYKLSVSNFISNLYIKIEGNEMIIDTGIASDGLLYKFVRKNCSNQPCNALVHTLVDAAAVPTTAMINQNVSIQIAYTVTNGCGQFGYIAETNSGNTKTLKVFARYVGCVCTENLMPIVSNYNFTPTSTGEQIIKIEQPDGTFLTHSITIQ
ncbi:MAG: hypothetical protein O9267_07830 [Flavobacterium sp.]|uniref:hypothetical protein n=1 Tax=Flavobacterium sp. TaxID=239 RepID=UPI0022C37EA7|nr:hypothetical protein [Flavobacterium sp.]MCZ8197500.1 hypothetical protein [Flavobacterium sp.]